jgi:NTP pyrophosphatase (non-canonical NTP hydrolase)
MAMDADLYQRAAARSLPAEGEPGRSLAVLGLGLAGEAGEVVELIKKHIGHGHAIDLEKIDKELGDVLWYVAALCEVLGIDMGDVMFNNNVKLRRRYPEGFDPARSQDRSSEGGAA